MPKEIIHEVRVFRNLTDKTFYVDPMAVQVSWSNEHENGTVQLGVINAVDPEEPEAGLFAHLTDQMLDDLIRVLKRARRKTRQAK
jgi:hypothetical protein